MIAAALIPAILPILREVLGRVIPDPAQRAQAESEAAVALLDARARLDEAAASVVLAEAKGESWLQRSWRPILMLTFGVLIVARWLGLAAPGLTEAEYLRLWSIVEIGLGGYVVGRSVEKVAATVAKAPAGSPLERWRTSR